MSLTLTLVLSLCLALIEGVRQNTVRLETECIVDIGVNSVLAEYHREVFQQYNLFFIDCSYGTDVSSYHNTEARLRHYVNKNLSSDEETGLLMGNALLPGIYMDPLKLETSKIKVSGVSLATDNKGYGFQQQAIQAVQSDIGVGFLEQVYSWITVVEDYGLREDSSDERAEELEQELEKIQDLRKKEDSWVAIDIENPVNDILEIRRKGILNWVLDDSAEISSKVISKEQYISVRHDKGIQNQGTILSDKKLTLFERLAFQEYLIRYAAHYLQGKENAGLDYQVEYLLFGEESDTENLRKTVTSICGMRETANLLYLSGSAEKMEMIKGLSTVLASAILVPEAEPVFEGLLLIGWAYLESLQDLKILMEGGKVPLVKDDSSWICSLENVFDLRLKKQNDGEGLSYEDYLRIYMYFKNLDEVTFRFMDLIEMDIRKTEGNSGFRMDNCIDFLEVKARITSAYGYEYEVKHAAGYR